MTQIIYIEANFYIDETQTRSHDVIFCMSTSQKLIHIIKNEVSDDRSFYVVGGGRLK